MIASTSCSPKRSGSRLALSVLAALVAVVGCQKSAPTEIPAASSQTISPRAMLRQMADAYKNCTSYEDAGELHIVPEGGAEEEPQPFAVALERPEKARIHSLGAMVVADGSKLRACTPSLEDQVLVARTVRLADTGRFFRRLDARAIDARATPGRVAAVATAAR